MKKSMICVILILTMAGCAEKQEYEQAVLEQMKQEKDIKDYKIEPEIMTKCVVETTGEHMPGMLPFDPDRLTAYKNYSKMIKLNASSDPKKTLEELRSEFGSAKNLADAHANYTESVVNCMSGLVTATEENLEDKKPK